MKITIEDDSVEIAGSLPFENGVCDLEKLNAAFADARIAQMNEKRAQEWCDGIGRFWGAKLVKGTAKAAAKKK